MKLTHKGQSNHWYSPEGQARHDADLRVARKDGLLPSVTSVIKGVLANPFLEKYKVNEAIKAALTLPRMSGEAEEAYAQRVLQESWRHSEQAAELGTRVHAELEGWNGAQIAAKPFGQGEHRFDYELERFCVPWMECAKKNLMGILASETVLADVEMGLAGTVDLVALHKDYGTVVCDYKTSKVKPDSRSGKKEGSFYPSYLWQLSAYAKMWARKHSLPEVPRIISFVVDVAEPGLYEKVWTAEEQERGALVMDLATKLWQVINRYRPSAIT